MKAATTSSRYSQAAPSAATGVSRGGFTHMTESTAPEPGPAPLRLTPRQLEVLALLCEGLPNKLICRQLNISAGTVKAHISSILREFGVASRLQAVVAARREGLLGETAQPTNPGVQNVQCAARPRIQPATVTTIDFGHRAAQRLGLTPGR